jgi:hypothetical protein
VHRPHGGGVGAVLDAEHAPFAGPLRGQDALALVKAVRHRLLEDHVLSARRAAMVRGAWVAGGVKIPITGTSGSWRRASLSG